MERVRGKSSWMTSSVRETRKTSWTAHSTLVALTPVTTHKMLASDVKVNSQLISRSVQ